MPMYQAFCRPHGKPNDPVSLIFLMERVDYRTAWEHAMNVCFNGGTVRDTEGTPHTLRPRTWTVQKLKLFERIAADEADEDTAEREPEIAPSKELLDPDVRERELARLYAGRQYDDVRFRRRRARLAA